MSSGGIIFAKNLLHRPTEFVIVIQRTKGLHVAHSKNHRVVVALQPRAILRAACADGDGNFVLHEGRADGARLLSKGAARNADKMLPR